MAKFHTDTCGDEWLRLSRRRITASGGAMLVRSGTFGEPELTPNDGGIGTWPPKTGSPDPTERERERERERGPQGSSGAKRPERGSDSGGLARPLIPVAMPTYQE